MKIIILKKNNYFQRRYFRRNGFEYNHKEKHWEKDNCSDDEKSIIVKYCRFRGIQCRILDGKYQRSSHYRASFFASNKGLFNKGIYQCVYCGKILTKNRVSVDHIIPVMAVENSITRKKYIKKLKKRGIEDINDPRNLVSACKRCNLKKGSKTGIWILRSKIGKYPLFWIIYYLAIIISLTVIVRKIITIHSIGSIELFLRQ